MKSSGAETFKLPPLILHPFSNPEDTSVLMASSRASLALQGFLPQSDASSEDLDEQLLRGRFAELKMLFYIGKDLMRWTEQCSETAVASGLFEGKRIRPETFAFFLIQDIPSHVRSKLEAWGVLDFCALFRRSIGLHAVFEELPTVRAFTHEFLRRYHRHLDQWYDSRLRNVVFDRIDPGDVTFDLYASGEYTMLLEQSWGSDSSTTE